MGIVDVFGMLKIRAKVVGIIFLERNISLDMGISLHTHLPHACADTKHKRLKILYELRSITPLLGHQNDIYLSEEAVCTFSK